MTTTTPLLPITCTPLFQSCVRNLRPQRITALEASSNLWKKIEKIFPYVYVILGTGAFIAVGITTPLNIPLVAFITLIGLPLIADPFIKYCREKIDSSQEEINQCRGMIEKGKDLPEGPLKPLIAYHLHQVDELTKLQSLQRCLAEHADALMSTKDTPALHAARSKAHCLKEAILTAKVTAAFTQALLQCPHYTQSIDTLCSLQEPAYTWRVLAREFNDPTADDLVIFTNSPLRLTIHQVNAWTISEIAQQFISVINNKPPNTLTPP